MPRTASLRQQPLQPPPQPPPPDDAASLPAASRWADLAALEARIKPLVRPVRGFPTADFVFGDVTVPFLADTAPDSPPCRTHGLSAFRQNHSTTPRATRAHLSVLQPAFFFR